MVEASGYLFQDVESLLKRARVAMAEAKIKIQATGVHDIYWGSLNSSVPKFEASARPWS